MKTRIELLLFLLATLLCMSGCKDTDKGGWTDCPPAGQQVGSIQIVMPTDTLLYSPGDSVAASGFIVVKDDAGRVMQDVKVYMELMDSIGTVEFVDDHDVTDSMGRVHIHFVMLHPEQSVGYATIHAWVSHKEDRWTMWIQPAADVVATLYVRVIPPLISLNNPPDSVLVFGCGSDSAHNYVGNFTGNVSATVSCGQVGVIQFPHGGSCFEIPWFVHDCRTRGWAWMALKIFDRTDSLSLLVN